VSGFELGDLRSEECEVGRRAHNGLDQQASFFDADAASDHYGEKTGLEQELPEEYNPRSFPEPRGGSGCGRIPVFHCDETLA
jgi:hypothetical protein